MCFVRAEETDHGQVFAIGFQEQLYSLTNNFLLENPIEDYIFEFINCKGMRKGQSSANRTLKFVGKSGIVRRYLLSFNHNVSSFERPLRFGKL
ncbi:hypothetical protein C1H46_032024 [Malus baccata]|uniref:Uncharacterized protein n=1 Tax=Malus baccata TaxID=106549 RepID=A0A540L7K4_MALBA|nr:hypothetical protein C1H46_032024 [Malus baccata]